MTCKNLPQHYHTAQLYLKFLLIAEHEVPNVPHLHLDNTHRVSTDEKLEEEKTPDKKKESQYLHRSFCAKKTKQTIMDFYVAFKSVL